MDKIFVTPPQEITVDGVVYMRKPESTQRAVVVVDRGWIFAGDVHREDGRIVLTDAVWVFRWESLGFDGVLANPKDDRVTIKRLQNPVDIPEGSEIFLVPVEAGWGLK